MLKSTIIAKCLFNSGICSSLDEGESIVASVFREKFPSDNFRAWNSDVNDDGAKQVIENVGRASTIRVDRFIDDLRNIR